MSADAHAPGDARYFATARREIVPWVPERCARLLDIGCGRGATTALLRSIRPVEWAGGVEFVAEEARAAEAVFDRVWSGDVREAALESAVAPGSLDLALCLDVLEHLPDPWGIVRRVSPLLAPGGRLIVSVPNIRNWKFVWGLFARGDFRYRDSGLLDRTHLRFFVRDTAVELACAGGLRLVHAGPAQPWRWPDVRAALSLASARRLDPLMEKQILVVAEALGGPAGEPSRPA